VRPPSFHTACDPNLYIYEFDAQSNTWGGGSSNWSSLRRGGGKMKGKNPLSKRG